MPEETIPDDEPCYVISIAARLVSLHPQTLRYYDRIGLLRPSRTSGRIRLYSTSDIERLRKIVRLTDELGVNLAGVEVILNMSDRIAALQRDLSELQMQAQAQIRALQARIREMEQEARASSDYQVINVSAKEVKERSKEDAP
ncbi:MAG: MerR family transcriptional regulator [Chloroflexi bacterium]|nr:MerR family transcriptional regulator [Chloroflexota bacterium]